MKVKELIQLLQAQDQELKVVVDGYEAGFDETNKIQLVKMKPNKDKGDNEKDDRWWDGEYEEVLGTEEGEYSILIPRKS